MQIEDYYNISLSKEEKDKIYKNHMIEKQKIEEEFAIKTGLNSTDLKFLFFAVALQVARQYILGGNLGKSFNKDERIDHDDKQLKKSIQSEREEYKNKNYSKEDKIIESKKEYRTWLEIAMTNKVPYDAIKGSKEQGLNLYGRNHREKTLGHDPLLGWIFGTLNIVTDTVTFTDFSSYEVDMKNDLKIMSSISLLEVFERGYESIGEDWLRLPAAIFAQGLHLKSDEFTKMGLPVPIVGVFNEEFAAKLTKMNYDSICFFRDLKTIGKQAIFSYLIDIIIAEIHRFFYYNENSEMDEKLYEVKIRKILLYSNIIASSSNIIATSFMGNINYLDIGGILKTIYRIVSDVDYIRKIKKEFISTKMNEKYEKRIAELNSELNSYLEEFGYKERF